MGTMVMFIRPDAASMVRTRDAIKSPPALKASVASTQVPTRAMKGPRRGMPNTKTPNASGTPTSTGSRIIRQSKNDSK